MSLVVACVVTRDSDHGGPTDLNLHNPGVYKVVTAGPGGITHDRRTVISHFLHGEKLVGSRKELTYVPLVVRAYGSTMAQLDSRVAAMCRAFDQDDYELQITIDAQPHRWACQPADYGPASVSGSGGSDEWDKFGLMSHQQAYRFNVPRDPIPITGGI